MSEVSMRVLWTIGDFAGLPEGTRIATNHNKLLICGTFAGAPHWYEEGELVNYTPLVHWLPAYVLPHTVDHKADNELHAAEKTLKKILGHDDWCKDGCWLQKTRATNADPA